MSFISLLPITNAVIRRQGTTSDAAGGSVLSWTVRISAYKCRIYSAVGMIKITSTGQNVLVTHKCIGQYNSGITEGDIIVHGADSYKIVQIDKVYGRNNIHHLEMRIKKENIDFG